MSGKLDRSSLGCFLLFCLPFAAVGGFMMFFIGRSLTDAIVLQDWVETPAVVRAADLEHGDGTHRATVRFAYEFAGTTHESEWLQRRNRSKDNIGPFHKNWAKRLRTLKQNGDVIPCYVNPKRPTQAVLFRGVRWEMIGFYSLFALVFGGIGIGLPIFVMVRGRRPGADLEPDADWEAARIMWPGPVRNDLGGRLVGLALLGGVFGAASVPLFVLAARGQPGLTLFGLPFLMVCLGCAASGARGLATWARFRHARLELEDPPGAIGGRLHGLAHLPVRLPPEAELLARLDCVRKEGSDEGQETVLWSASRRHRAADCEPDAIGSRLRIGFDIPETARPSTGRELPGTVWRLTLRARLAGPDLHLRFPVPVYAVPPRPADRVGDPPGELLHATGIAIPNLAGALAAQGVEFAEYTDGNIRLEVPPLRALGMHILGFVVLGVMLAGGVALIAKGWVIGHVLGALATILLFLTARSYLRRTRFETEPDGFFLREPLLGIGRTRWFGRDEVDTFESKFSGSANQTRYFDILAILQDGRKVKVARWLIGREVADAVVKQLREFTGSGAG